jgi:hypothetical protein
MVSLAVAVERMSSALDFRIFNVSGRFFVCFPFPFEADGLCFVVPTSSGIAAACVASNSAPWFVCFFFFFEAGGVGSGISTAARVASNSASSSSARLRHASHSSDTGLETDRQR